MRAVKYFNKRLEKGVNVQYAKKVGASSLKIQNRNLYNAINEILTSLLKRPPTEEELLGHTKLHIT